MITEFDKYKEPKVNDYVVVDHNIEFLGFNKYIKNKIGQIIKTNGVNWNNWTKYCVLFDNIPKNFKNPTDWYINEILFFSPNKIDCEIFIESNKYNL